MPAWVGDGAGAGRAVVELAGLCLGKIDELPDVLRRQGGVDHQHHRDGGGEHHRRIVLESVVVHLGVQRRADHDCRGVVEDRIAVGERARRLLGGDVAARAGLVVHHHLLAHLHRELLRDHARDNVGRPAGREGDDHAHRLGGVGLRTGQAGACSQGEPREGTREKLEFHFVSVVWAAPRRCGRVRYLFRLAHQA
jgi:hypothetical protein